MLLFGKKKAPAATAPPATAPNPINTSKAVEAIKVLRGQLDTFEKREEFLAKKIQIALQEAIKKKQKGDQKGALTELKRKKMFESEIEKLQGTRITLDSQINALESAAINVEAIRAMKTGADALKAVRGNLDADAVEDMMESINEERDIHDQISEAISAPGRDLFDDEELLKELDELDAIEEPVVPVSKSSVSVNSTTSTVFNFPVAPTSPISSSSRVETDEERELRELSLSMAM